MHPAKSPRRTAKKDVSLSRLTLLPPFPETPPDAPASARLANLLTWLRATRPLRVLRHWSERRGGTLASGMAYSALFSAFAALLVFFSVIGLVLGHNRMLLQALIRTLSHMVPGLIGVDGQKGVVAAQTLLTLDTAGTFTVAGLIALVSTLWTAMNFLNGTRLAIRAMFDLPAAPERNLLLTRLTDLGLLACGAVTLVLTAVMIAAGAGAVTWLFTEVLGLRISGLVGALIRVVSVTLSLAFNTVIVAAMLRVLSQIRVPRRTLWTGALGGGIAIGVLAYLGSALLGQATANALVATFATLLGVLIFFNFLCVVLLLTASWVKVTMDDLGQPTRILTLKQAEDLALAAELTARQKRLASTRLRLEAELRQLPRWRRRRVRRDYERVIAEQEAANRERLALRLGYDPIATEARQHESTAGASRERR